MAIRLPVLCRPEGSHSPTSARETWGPSVLVEAAVSYRMRS